MSNAKLIASLKIVLLFAENQYDYIEITDALSEIIDELEGKLKTKGPGQ